jgi:nucleotide-binding universal stress UspA family protein
MKLVIAATDFSGNSLNAVEYAAGLAASIRSELLIIHVAPLPVLLNDIPIPFPARADDSIDAELSALRAKLLHEMKDPIAIRTETVQGDVVQSLQQYCESEDVFSLVLGSETAGWLERTIVGATAVEAAKKLHCPVLVVPPGKHFAAIHTIGLACKPANIDPEFPADTIIGIVKGLGAGLHILFATNDTTAAGAAGAADEVGFIPASLKPLKPTFQLIAAEDPVTGIESFAVEHQIDLLFVISRTHGVLHSVLHHEHLAAFLTDPLLPVMVIHPRAANEA